MHEESALLSRADSWQVRPLGELATLQKGISYTSDQYCDPGEGADFITIKCVSKAGGFRDAGIKHYKGPIQPQELLQSGDILIANTDLTRAGDIVGCPVLVPELLDRQVTMSMDLSKLIINQGAVDTRFLYHRLMLADARRFMREHSSGSTVLHLKTAIVPTLQIGLPATVDEQRAIAQVLDTVDDSIRQTQAIIEKLKQVKQGLLHDLLTRGIDANGELRPPQSEAPNLYKESALGWIPTDWQVRSVDEVAESIVDGPFGSNLKTEHYVSRPGVRVVRLQNIGIGDYDDSERAFVSVQKALSLIRNEVCGGDVLVAALGDARYPVGRACCYPDDLPPAVNKADCFRLRPRNELAIGEFVMRILNGAVARRQVRGFEQGVTMQRVNIGNLKRIVLALPPVEEQQSACAKLAALDKTLATNVEYLLKSRQQKSGLMGDLLTGRVRVTPFLD